MCLHHPSAQRAQARIWCLNTLKGFSLAIFENLLIFGGVVVFLIFSALAADGYFVPHERFIVEFYWLEQGFPALPFNISYEVYNEHPSGKINTVQAVQTVRNSTQYCNLTNVLPPGRLFNESAFLLWEPNSADELRVSGLGVIVVALFGIGCVVQSLFRLARDGAGCRQPKLAVVPAFGAVMHGLQFIFYGLVAFGTPVSLAFYALLTLGIVGTIRTLYIFVFFGGRVFESFDGGARMPECVAMVMGAVQAGVVIAKLDGSYDASWASVLTPVWLTMCVVLLGWCFFLWIMVSRTAGIFEDAGRTFAGLFSSLLIACSVLSTLIFVCENLVDDLSSARLEWPRPWLNVVQPMYCGYCLLLVAGTVPLALFHVFDAIRLCLERLESREKRMKREAHAFVERMKRGKELQKSCTRMPNAAVSNADGTRERAQWDWDWDDQNGRTDRDDWDSTHAHTENSDRDATALYKPRVSVTTTREVEDRDRLHSQPEVPHADRVAPPAHLVVVGAGFQAANGTYELAPTLVNGMPKWEKRVAKTRPTQPVNVESEMASDVRNGRRVAQTQSNGHEARGIASERAAPGVLLFPEVGKSDLGATLRRESASQPRQLANNSTSPGDTDAFEANTSTGLSAGSDSDEFVGRSERAFSGSRDNPLNGHSKEPPQASADANPTGFERSSVASLSVSATASVGAGAGAGANSTEFALRTARNHSSSHYDDDVLEGEGFVRASLEWHAGCWVLKADGAPGLYKQVCPAHSLQQVVPSYSRWRATCVARESLPALLPVPCVVAIFAPLTEAVAHVTVMMSAQAARGHPQMLRLHSTVRLRGLTSLSELNGYTGQIHQLHYAADGLRYVVDVAGDCYALDSKNLEAVSRSVQERHPVTLVPPRTIVRLRGLDSMPSLNNRVGVIQSYDVHRMRYIVTVDDVTLAVQEEHFAEKVPVRTREVPVAPELMEARRAFVLPALGPLGVSEESLKNNMDQLLKVIEKYPCLADDPVNRSRVVDTFGAFYSHPDGPSAWTTSVAHKYSELVRKFTVASRILESDTSLSFARRLDIVAKPPVPKEAHRQRSARDIWRLAREREWLSDSDSATSSDSEFDFLV